MTRSEALKKIGDVAFMGRDVWLLHCLSVLGLLNLDEPEPKKNPMTVFCEEMNWPEGGASYQVLFRSLEKAGLTITAK